MHEAPGTGRELKKAHTVTLPDKLAVKDEYKKTPPLAACFSEVDYNFAIFAFLFSLSLCYSNFVSGFFCFHLRKGGVWDVYKAEAQWKEGAKGRASGACLLSAFHKVNRCKRREGSARPKTLAGGRLLGASR